ncbi:MAG: hypothetical protein AAFN41_02320 [Planctomycetota bacterium]
MSSSKRHIGRVLKFGSSVLRSPDDLPDVAAEVLRQLRAGVIPVVVVSAFRGRTDELHRIAEGVSPGSAARSALLGVGELEAAAAVAVAIERCGVSARLIEPEQVGITAAGEREESWPVRVEPEAIVSAVSCGEVSVVPGYIARGEDGSPHLLGRGGSDLTAISLGDTLRAEPVLIKGSGAVYEWDPKERGPKPRRFVEIGFDDALALGDRVLQARALEYARAHQVPFVVTGLGGAAATRVIAGAGYAVLADTDDRIEEQTARRNRRASAAVTTNTGAQQ